MMIFWRGRRYTIYVLHRSCISPFPEVVTALLCSWFDWWEKTYRGPMSPDLWFNVSTLGYICWSPPFVPKGWSLWTPSWRQKYFSSLLLAQIISPFPIFYQSVKVFHGVVGPHHLYGIFLEINFIYRRVDLEKVWEHGECGHMSEYFYLVHQWGQE